MAKTVYRFDVGAWGCIALHDGQATFSATEFFSTAPRAELEGAMAAHSMEPDALPLSINLLLVSDGTNRVLTDTGVGRDVGGGEGQVLARLASVGVTPADVDVVAITHGHWDHIGGLTDDDGALLFPQARHVMSAIEWDYWTSAETLAGVDAMLAQWAQENLPALMDRVELLADGDEVVPGLTVVEAPGHTLGQVAYSLHSEGRELVHIGDAAHHPLQVARPEIRAAADIEPGVAAATWRRLLSRVADSDALLYASHFPFPGVGRVRSEANRWTWHPLNPTAGPHPDTHLR